MAITQAQLESKRLWVESIQKDITEVCFGQCFDSEELNIDGSCLKSCYSKYKEVLNVTNSKLKDIGYACESQIAYKVWKKNHPMNDTYYDKTFSGYMKRVHFVQELNVMTGEKS